MVDTKCGFPKGKLRKEDIAFNSEPLEEDEHLLRPPIRTSCAGFREAKKAYENGTDEVRRLLMEECALIYECNVCRNMFRSLANFINHKRHYCKSATLEDVYAFPNRSSSVLIKTVQHTEPNLIKSRSTGSSPIPNSKSTNRDLSKVIERLKRVEVSSGCVHKKHLAEEHNMQISSLETNAPEPVLELESVSTTTHAVYQTLKMKNDTDSIKTELDEVQNLLTNQKTLLGPDGKAILSPTTSITVAPSTINDENNFKVSQLFPGVSCEICNMAFRTEKTLKMHIQKHHSSSTYVFQCPTCSMTFLQPAAVIRHLANEHKKPLRRIRKMRDMILKKRIQIGDLQVRGGGREVKRLKMTNTKDLDIYNLADSPNRISITSCTYCCKNFERRAALATHLTSCSARKSSINDPECSKKTDVANKNRSEAIIPNKVTECINGNDKIMNGTGVVVNIKQEPPEDLNSSTNSSNINKLFENLENQTFGNGLHTVCLEKIQMMVELGEKSSLEQDKSTDDCNQSNPECHSPKSNKSKTKEKSIVTVLNTAKKEKSKRFRIVSAPKQLTCRCKICNKQFNALSNLRRHISMFHYRSRRFGCNLCDYRAFRRYDIVNHLTFVHKMTGERESMAIEYVTVHEIKYSKDDVDGDIVVVTDDSAISEQKNETEKQNFNSENAPKTYEKREKCKKMPLKKGNKDILQPIKMDCKLKSKSHGKIVRRKFKKSLEEQAEGKNRPIRNRIKTVNKDFIYDLLTIREESKKPPRIGFKRRNSLFVDQNNLKNDEFAPPPIKITPYRLRTEPLMPSDKCSVKGAAANACRNVIQEGLAAPSILPELPTERPQMRPRLISSSRTDTIAVIETSELEAAGLRSTFFDDSFLEKFAKKSNPSFKMKPLLALKHSPLNSILQKFDASQQSNINRKENKILEKPTEKDASLEPDCAIRLLQNITQSKLKPKEVTPNGKLVSDTSSPPAAPKKRITLMQRLAENRARATRRDSLICTGLEN